MKSARSRLTARRRSGQLLRGPSARFAERIDGPREAHWSAAPRQNRACHAQHASETRSVLGRVRRGRIKRGPNRSRERSPNLALSSSPFRKPSLRQVPLGRKTASLNRSRAQSSGVVPRCEQLIRQVWIEAAARAQVARRR